MKLVRYVSRERLFVVWDNWPPLSAIVSLRSRRRFNRLKRISLRSLELPASGSSRTTNRHWFALELKF